MDEDKEFEVEGVRYLRSASGTFWRWDGEKWVPCYFAVLRDPPLLIPRNFS